MEWFKIFHGLPLDTRLTVVARRSNLSRAEALSLYLALHDHASRAARRGSVDGFDAELFSVGFDCEPSKVDAAMAAFRDKGMILPNGQLADWVRQQAMTSRERVQAHRRRKEEPRPQRGTTGDPDSDADARRQRLAAQSRNAAAQRRQEPQPPGSQRPATFNQGRS